MTGNSLIHNQFKTVMDGLLNGHDIARLAVAVSGGADSMALALLTKEYCDMRGVTLTALTVDHGLRTEAKDEAMQVQRWLSPHGISTAILTLDMKPSSGVQEAARAHRYESLINYCSVHNMDALVLAHHSDDQQETLLQRLIAGSGVDGMRGMEPVSQQDNIFILRPLLSFNKNELVDFLQLKNQDFITDPSNEKDAFTRVRLRKMLSMLRDEGLSFERMNIFARRMDRARTSLEWMVDQFMAMHSLRLFWGGVSVDAAAFLSMPDEIAIRILQRCFGIARGNVYFYPKLSAVEDLLSRLKADHCCGTHTMHEVIISGDCEKGRMMIGREGGMVDATSRVIDAPMVCWDNRINISILPSLTNIFYVRPYRDEDAVTIKETGDKDILKSVPAIYRYGLPVICARENDKPVAAHFLGLSHDDIDEKLSHCP